MLSERCRKATTKRSPKPQIQQALSDKKPDIADKTSFWGQKSVLLPVLASVALHGLVIIVLPYISDSKTIVTPPLPSPIQVVELTPAERGRIPTLAATRTSVDSLPTIFYQPVLPIAPKPTQVDAPSALSIFLRPVSSPIPVLTDRQPLYPQSSIFDPNLPVSIFSPPVRGKVKTNPQPSSSVAEKVEINPKPSPLVAEKVKINRQPPVREKVEINPKPSPLVAEKVKINPQPPDGEKVETNPEPSPSSTSEVFDFSSNSSQNPLPEITPQIEDNSIRSVLSSSDIKDDASRTNYQNWAVRLEISANKFNRVFVNGNYPEAACVKQLNTEVTVAVLIDSDLQPNYPELIKSSGDKVFDEQAITDTMSYNFEEAVAGEPYLVILNYEHNGANCDGLNQTGATDR
jgi:outer membrane biosynthesis protein TonB